MNMSRARSSPNQKTTTNFYSFQNCRNVMHYFQIAGPQKRGPDCEPQPSFSGRSRQLLFAHLFEIPTPPPPPPPLRVHCLLIRTEIYTHFVTLSPFSFVAFLCWGRGDASQFHRSGRAKDARKHHGEAEETREDRESGAKLEYRDQWGRAITRKEAFRNLCYQVGVRVARAVTRSWGGFFALYRLVFLRASNRALDLYTTGNYLFNPLL